MKHFTGAYGFFIRLKDHDKEKYAAHAALLSWIYASGDYGRREVVIATISARLPNLNPSELKSFRDDCLVTAHQQVDFVHALRRSLLSRYNDDVTYFRVLQLFMFMSHHRHMLEGVASFEPPDRPIFWVMKVLQRQLCMRAGRDWEFLTVIVAFECMSYVGFTITRSPSVKLSFRMSMLARGARRRGAV